MEVANIDVNSTSSTVDANPISQTMTDDQNQTPLFKDPLPLELTYYSSDPNHYALLESKETSIRQYNGPPTRIHLPLNGLSRKITLNDFPFGQYTLQINGTNVASAKFDKNEGCLAFDFSKPSAMLELYIDRSKADNEPFIGSLDRKKYLNFSRIDSVIIILPKDIIFNHQHQLAIFGYDKSNEDDGLKWIHDQRVLDVYPSSTYHLHLNFPTDYITVRAISVSRDPAYPSMVKLRINGRDQGSYPFIDLECQIKLSDKDYKYQGGANKYLSPVINRNTLNFSRVNDVALIAFNCQLDTLYQHYYNIYTYPSRKLVFTH
jgi:hypothetical protein